MATVLLYESAMGYSLFDVIEGPEVSLGTEEVTAAMNEASRFAKLVKLKAFAPFSSAEHALENINCVSEGVMSEYLKGVLEANVPVGKKVKKGKLTLGVYDSKLGAVLHDELGLSVSSNERIQELLRGIRIHYEKLLGQLQPGDLPRAQLGLAHSYSRSKVKFNVHKADNMIIQSIALLDQLDKDINTFAMRAKEWYSWHFPELAKIVPDNYQYARLVNIIKNKTNANEEILPQIEEIVIDETIGKEILDAARSSMGTDVSDIDLVNIEMFASRVVRLAEYRKSLYNYLSSKMHNVAPNLGALLGDQVGARLIAHAGSLTNLAKYPASTVQILGAEKALFRALKTKGKTPKYGLLFHSSYIGKAKQKNKGRISRYLANKCSIASRVDCFAETTSDIFGQKLKEQVEERLKFYDSGARPRKNIDVMHLAQKEVAETEGNDKDEKEEKAVTTEKDKKTKKRKASEAVEDGDTGSSKKKKDKKDKKEKKAKKS
eukprot:Plantae.Rhodophyta-Purpureofilum_apyrenoidigerum.ctg2464.p1 GENE.Plantae.Rhodophyta-Purpureofilum_apyrenoidigerum.ctg2464~~Plantae.Rhodophyta-Purpureofilum_apyrenoidigerum.ctg2464.p1  ORF type:complete len:490 (-),score=133.96 Plantae.Rhodophyta-Purpureofilum_apyrenoidigerum.ctg2464:120-1589(-)